MPKKPIYSIVVSQCRDDKNNWALHLTEGTDKDNEKTMVHCQFTNHPMMDEDIMNEMMGELRNCPEIKPTFQFPSGTAM